MPYLGKYPSRDRAHDRAKLTPIVTSRGMGLHGRPQLLPAEGVDNRGLPKVPAINPPALDLIKVEKL